MRVLKSQKNKNEPQQISEVKLKKASICLVEAKKVGLAFPTHTY